MTQEQNGVVGEERKESTTPEVLDSVEKTDELLTSSKAETFAQAEKTLKKATRMVLWLLYTFGGVVSFLFLGSMYGLKNSTLDQIPPNMGTGAILLIWAALVILFFAMLVHFVREYGSRFSLLFCIIASIGVSVLITWIVVKQYPYIRFYPEFLLLLLAANIFNTAMRMIPGFKAIRTLKEKSYFENIDARKKARAKKIHKQVAFQLFMLVLLVLIIIIGILLTMIGLSNTSHYGFSTKAVESLVSNLQACAFILFGLMVGHFLSAFYVMITPTRNWMCIAIFIVGSSTVFGCHAVYKAAWQPSWYSGGVWRYYGQVVGLLIGSLLFALPLLRGFRAIRTLGASGDTEHADIGNRDVAEKADNS